MAESMQGLKRSHRCAELSKVNIGETVTVMDGCRRTVIKVELYSWIYVTVPDCCSLFLKMEA